MLNLTSTFEFLSRDYVWEPADSSLASDIFSFPLQSEN